MEILLIGAVVIGIGWLVLPKLFATHVQAPDTLRGTNLEEAIIEVKQHLLSTSAYESEAKYIRLHERLTALVRTALERHWHYVREVQAKPGGIPFGLVFQRSESYDKSGLPHPTVTVNPGVSVPFVEKDVLLYLCFFLYLGGRPKESSEIEADTSLMLKILDQLIDEHSFAPAVFLKGFVLKYGEKVHKRPRIGEARKLLERAASLGVGSASVELEHINKHAHLEHAASVHE